LVVDHLCMEPSADAGASEPGFAFREVFDAGLDALLIVDAHGTIVAVSARARDLFGQEVDKVVGRPIEVLVPDARRSGSVRRRTARRLDGSEVPVEICLNPLETSVGRFALCAVRDVSDRVQLEARTELLASLVASSDDAISAADCSGIVTEWNRGAERLYGYRADEIIGQPASVLAPTDEIASEQDRMRETVIASRQPVRFETRRRRKDGTIIHIAVRYSPILGSRGEVAGYSMIGRDITERVRMIEELGLRARLLDAVDAGVIAIDMDGIVRHWSSGAERLSAWSAEEVVGRHIIEVSVDPRTTEVMTQIQQTGSWEGMFPLHCKDGRIVPGFVRGILWHDQEGRPAGIVAASVDVAERLAIEEDLRAARDFLAAITENVGEGLMVIDEEGQITFANKVAAKLVGCSRAELLQRRIIDLLAGESDAMPAVLASLQPTDGVARVDSEHAICADGSRLAVDIASSPMHQPGARQWALVMADDTARRERIHRLKQELDEIGWIGRITDALGDDSLVLHAQPIVRIDSGEVRHHELLLRLRSADGSLIAPGRFLPTAEKHGLITQIDRWVLGRALEIAAAGRRVAVNLATATLADSDAPCYIADRIQRSSADPRNLLFEITETAVLGDLHAGQNLVSKLVELGCQVALDDFGTGYGGFTYLKHLPISVLKIDTEFVRDVAENPASDRVIRAIVGLAHSFGLETVAEGVEDERTLETLHQLGVDLAQGYFIGRPGPLDAARLTGP